MNLVKDGPIRFEDTPGQHYTEEFRVAVTADVALLGVAATCAKYRISRSLLSYWRKTYAPQTQTVLRSDRISALLANYLESNLQALTAQAYVTADPEYLNRQPAESIAVLHKVMGDQAIRLLEAIHQASRPEEGSESSS